MGRFFSSFPHGRFGVGLLLLRAIASLMGIGLVASRLTTPSASSLDIAIGALSIATGLGVLTGLFTTASATILAVTITWFWFPLHADVMRLGVPAAMMTIVVAIAIALLGPGSFSIDARLFGPREIVVPRGRRARNVKAEGSRVR